VAVLIQGAATEPHGLELAGRWLGAVRAAATLAVRETAADWVVDGVARQS
jgi:hypothetical protein